MTNPKTKKLKKPRINLQIDEVTAKMLESIKQSYPIFGDVDVIKLAINDFYLKKQLEERQKWADSLPIIRLTKAHEDELRKNYKEVPKSEYIEWDFEEFEIEIKK